MPSLHSLAPVDDRRRSASNGVVVDSGDNPNVNASASAGPPVVHEAVKQRVRAQLGRRWPVGSCLPPIRELARELDAGETSTYRAMRELAAEGLLMARRGQGTYVMRAADDVPAPTAAPRHPQRKLVHMVSCRENPDLFVRQGSEALQEQLQGHDVEVRRLHIEPDRDGLVTLPPDLPGQGVVVLHPPPGPLRVRDDQVLCVISTHQRIAIDMTERFDVVGIDQFQGGLLAGRLLRQAGCRDIYFIGACVSDSDRRQRPTSQARFDGFVQGWGQPVDPRHIYLRPYTSQLLGVQAARNYLDLDKRPDGVFAVTDDVAASFQIGMMTSGLSARRDYQLVGFDGQEQGRLVVGGPLSTVQVPSALMGREAADLLLSRLQDPAQPIRHHLLGCSLYQGNTTRVLR